MSINTFYSSYSTHFTKYSPSNLYFPPTFATVIFTLYTTKQ